MENKYNNGKIYKIVCNTTNKIYIGSTVEKYLCNRLSGHVNKYKNLKNISKRGVFEIIGGGNYQIVLIENFSCNSKDELTKREKEIIDEYKNNFNVVNNINPFTSKEEYNERALKWQKENPEKRKEIWHKWYNKNKDKRNEIRKEKGNCPHCNKEMLKRSILRHIKESCKKI